MPVFDGQGFAPELELLSTYPPWTSPEARRDAIHATIEMRASQGIQYFFLIGGCRDWSYLAGPLASSWWPWVRVATINGTQAERVVILR